MKKTLKLVLIFVGGLIGIIVAAISGFLIISKNKTYYIYDVRIVEPVSGLDGYVYTDSERNYTEMKNKTVYMNSSGTNMIPMSVFAHTSTNDTNVVIKSSDTNVARIVYKGDKCYVKYVREGIATISSEIGGVKDSFILKVLDQIPSKFNVYDYDYYGDYAELFPNSLIGYADDQAYRYKYFLQNVSETGDNTSIDGDLLRLDESNLDTNVFSYVSIDSTAHELVLKCKVPDNPETDNIDSTIVLQSYYISDKGEEVVQNNYLVNVHIVLYVPEFLQIEVSSNPDFSEKYVYTNTRREDISSLSDEQIQQNPEIIEQYLSAVKAENYLATDGQKATYNVLFSERVKKVYIRFRMVYTNGHVETLVDGDNADFEENGSALSESGYCKLTPLDNYYILTLDSDGYFYGSSEYVINVSLKDYTFDFDFVFKYKPLTNSNVDEYYSFDEDTNIYTFNYWDERAHFDNECFDEFGNIVGFGE